MSFPDQTLSVAERIHKARGADLLSYLRRRLRNDADARDIAQEAFLRFLRLDDPERLRAPEAYLFRIAANLLWERRLRDQKQTGHELASEMLTDEQTPFESVVADEQASLLRAVLEGLPPVQRAIVMLHLRDGMTFSQIAAHTGIGLSLAKKLYYKAVVACREQLIDKEVRPGEGR